MYENTEAQPHQYYQQNRDSSCYYRGRGRGGHYYNRGGKGRGLSYTDFDMTKITCYRCDKNGHFASHCPDRLLKLHEASET